jgi:hypothetical protein
MRSDNAERFKELLIWLTSIKATEDDFVRWENWNSSWKEQILRVVGDRDAVTKGFIICGFVTILGSVNWSILEKMETTSMNLFSVTGLRSI